MKHGKKPTAAQRKFIEAHGLNPENWLVSQDNQERMLLIHRHFDRIKIIHKEERDNE